MAISTIEAPAALPVSLEDFKKHLRIDHVEEDEFLGETLNGAVAYVEAGIRQSLIHRTIRQYCDTLPLSNRITLEGWPFVRLVSVQGYNITGEMVAIDPARHRVVVDSLSAELVFDPMIDRATVLNGFEIDFVTGYGETSIDIPSIIVQAIKRLAAHWYELRGSGEEGASHTLPVGLDKLLAPVRRMSL